MKAKLQWADNKLRGHPYGLWYREQTLNIHLQASSPQRRPQLARCRPQAPHAMRIKLQRRKSALGALTHYLRAHLWSMAFSFAGSLDPDPIHFPWEAPTRHMR